MDATYKRHSRRSHPNLQHLSVTPLTGDGVNSAAEDSSTGIKSYIAPRSGPPTPSILSSSRPSSRTHSRSNSRSRLYPGTRASKSNQALADLAFSFTPLSTSKSSTNLPNHGSSTSGRIKPVASSDAQDWLLQTASTLTLSTAESKGQAWLATRTSSTSLVDDPRYQSPYSPTQDSSSRPQSRFTSRGNSRRGSKVGIMTPAGMRTPGERRESSDKERNYFDQMGVDFMDEGEDVIDEEEEDGEIRKLVWGRAKGWVDWAVGWMDFRDDLDEGEAAETEHSGKAPSEAVGSRRRKRRDENDRILVEKTDDLGAAVIPPLEGNGAVSDAKWLLTVASKILV